MTKVRLLILLTTIFFVGSAVTIVSFYARGYRFKPGKLTLSANGLLVVKSDPEGAQILINRELKSASNATLPLPPGKYDVTLKKEGYFEWYKRLDIEKEVVTQVTSHLFKSVPSLTPITFTGVVDPTASDDFTKIAFFVPPNAKISSSGESKEGLWVLETFNLPIGFSRDAKRITDGDLTNSTINWAPDGREILLKTASGAYLIDSSKFTPQSQWINISPDEEKIMDDWVIERKSKRSALIKKLPDQFNEIISKKAGKVLFSPDEKMLVYSASTSAQIPDNLIKPLPGASTQREERELAPGRIYVYDILEDKNFLIDENSEFSLLIGAGTAVGEKRRISWFPTSKNLVLAEEGRVVIMDYDGTNRQTVYSGSYLSPHAFPTLSSDRLIILTNLGADSTLPNLYSLSLK